MSPQSPQGPGRNRRRVAMGSDRDLVTVKHGSHSILSLVEPVVASVELADWIGLNRERVMSLLNDRGALLFRGFHISGPEDFRNVAAVWSGGLLKYTYGSTPRRQVGAKNVYTSTEYPLDQSIPLHNEMSYSRIWPDYVWFYCEQPAIHGGVTPLADSRLVGERVDRGIWNAFAELGVKYVRNYKGDLDLSWQQAFETDRREQVEQLCEAQEIEYDWLDGDCLRTSQVSQAVAEHPGSGASVWFNQAHLFHISALPAEVRCAILENGPSELPRQAYFGDGTEIPDSALSNVRAAYDAMIVREPWHKGDILLIDNMLVAHGRDPYRGERRILVAMTGSHDGGRRMNVYE
jgi:alpha-ketoglutarate-dependent taurine dioxygenase